MVGCHILRITTISTSSFDKHIFKILSTETGDIRNAIDDEELQKTVLGLVRWVDGIAYVNPQKWQHRSARISATSRGHPPQPRGPAECPKARFLHKIREF